MKEQKEKLERRTIHIYCGRVTDKHLSNHTIFPPRLWQGKDASTQKYYSRLNPITKEYLKSLATGGQI
jgi:hypothetical protein